MQQEILSQEPSLLTSNVVLRRCIKCKIEKPATADFFHRDKNRYLGLMYRCKECDAKRVDNRTWEERKSNMTPAAIARQLIAKKAYAKTAISKAIMHVSAYKKADSKRGFVTDLTKHDILSVKSEFCVYCGFPATGFDRVDNSRGHTKDNCVPCCLECNVARMDNFSFEEMKIIGEAIREVKSGRVIKN